MISRFFTLLITASCLTALGQAQVEYPYNPDGNSDGMIGVTDLQDLLASYGLPFAPDSLLGNSLDSLYNVVDSLEVSSSINPPITNSNFCRVNFPYNLVFNAYPPCPNYITIPLTCSFVLIQSARICPNCCGDVGVVLPSEGVQEGTIRSFICDSHYGCPGVYNDDGELLAYLQGVQDLDDGNASSQQLGGVYPPAFERMKTFGFFDGEWHWMGENMPVLVGPN